MMTQASIRVAALMPEWHAPEHKDLPPKREAMIITGSNTCDIGRIRER